MNKFKHYLNISLSTIKCNAFFLKTLFIFTMLIFLCIGVFGFINQKYVSIEMKNMILKSNMDLLNQVENIFDQHYFRFYDITKQLSLDQQVNKCFYISEEDNPNTMILYKGVINTLKSLQLSNEYIENISIYFHKSDIIVTQQGKYTADFYFSHYNTEIADIFKNNKDSLFPFGYQYKNDDNLTFATSIPLFEGYPSASVYIEVKDNMFYNLIEKINKDIPSHILIIDPDGTIITEYSSNISGDIIEKINNLIVTNINTGSTNYLKEISSLGFEVNKITSDITKYNFVSLLPIAFIDSKLSFTRNVNKISILAIMVISSIFAYFIISKLYKPIKDIVNFILLCSNSKIIPNNELEVINSFVNFISKENSNLKLIFKKNHYKVQKKILIEILDGKISEQKFFDEYNQEYFNCNFRFDFYLVISIDIYSKNAYDEIDNIIYKLEESLFSEKQEICYYFVERRGKVITLLINHNYSNYFDNIIYLLTDKIKEIISHNFNTDFLIGVGNNYYGFNNISQSFMESLYALKNRLIKGDNCIIFIDEVENLNHIGLYLQLEDENRFINIIKSGDTDKVERFLENLFENSIKTQNYSIEAIDNFFNILANLIIRCIYDMKIDIEKIIEPNYNIYKLLSNADDFYSKKQILKTFAIYVTESLKNQAKNHHEVIYSEIINFIQTNYEKDISLTLLGDCLKYSVPYLSYIFKQVSGELFVDYVNKFRITKAKELMKSTDDSLITIALNVGFTNANNFNRVFKKFEDITPGQYRKNLKDI